MSSRADPSLRSADEGNGTAPALSSPVLYDALDAARARCRDNPTLAAARELWQLRRTIGEALVAGQLAPRQHPSDPGHGAPSSAMLVGLPVVRRAALTTPLLKDALSRYGCLLVKGFAAAEQAARLRSIVMQSFEAFERVHADIAAGRAPASTPDYAVTDFTLNGSRCARIYGAIRADEAPLAAFELTELFAEHPVLQIFAEFFGQRPVISHTKTVIRKSEPHRQPPRAVFHQDGSFLHVRTVNVWLALSSAGFDSPGIELLPRAVAGFESMGEAGSILPYEIDAQALYQKYGRDAFWCPIFAPGDALILHERCIHRSYFSAAMTNDRYATETWFFAPDMPKGQEHYYYV